MGKADTVVGTGTGELMGVSQHGSIELLPNLGTGDMPVSEKAGTPGSWLRLGDALHLIKSLFFCSTSSRGHIPMMIFLRILYNTVPLT